jgi:hypothetical protein
MATRTTTEAGMVVATKLAMFTAGLVLALIAGWGLGHVLGPTLTNLTPPGAPALQHPHTPTVAPEESS